MTFGKHQYFLLKQIKHDAIPFWFLLITPILVSVAIPYFLLFIY